MLKSLGFLEVEGIAAAVVGCDAMVKSAYVELVTVKADGDGHLQVIVCGDLASVKEALVFGTEAASRIGQVVAAKAIARPYEGLERLIGPWEGSGMDGEG
ncbi:MAG: BMC domain-containing protein [Turicibacter sp.]|nr:BMC domain-containing protein [Turicibacter sp.]